MGNDAMSEPDPRFESLLQFVRDERSFDYTGYRRPTLMRRFEKRMQAVGADDWDAYRAYLAEHPEEYVELFNTILINVTGFFRDREAWNVVAEQVIPRLLEDRGDAPIRVWSAGCASGEEPYTIAILLAEALGEEAFRRQVKIYATDIDDDALTEAREASFSTKQLEKVPPDLRKRYFQQQNHGFVFKNELRRTVIFGRNDLHRDPPISRVDLLLSRNTLMYFDPETQQRILANFYFALKRGGFLLVGKAEALQSGRNFFVPYDLKRRIFMKDGAVDPGFRLPRLPQQLAVAQEEHPRELGEAAFERAPVAQVVVDDQNHVAGINQAARAAFSLRHRDVGRQLQDLEISYRPVELRSLIDEVRNSKETVTRRDVRWQKGNEEPRTLDVEVSPLAVPGEHFAGVIVSFVDATEHRALEEDLKRATRELETAYEELQSTVEELETTNEELQSTNEELETTNEELQSTNEELETMNEELQSTNEELETMNDELRDRTDETLQANSFLGSVLSGIHQGVVVVDRGLRVVAWSRRATELWGLRDDEVEGENLLNLDIGIAVQRLRDPIRHILAGAAAEGVELDGHDRRGKPVRVRISFAPLQNRPEAEEPDGAILLVSAERSG
jgi:two-component system CheB/CheR fusion protein